MVEDAGTNPYNSTKENTRTQRIIANDKTKNMNLECSGSYLVKMFIKALKRF